MNLPEHAVRLAVRTLPRSQRRTREEEWLADLDGCDELAISRRQVALGALATVIYERLHPRARSPWQDEGTTKMDRSAWAALRLVGYTVWVAAAAAWAHILIGHVANSGGSNTWGYTFRDGPSIELDIALLVSSLIVLALGIVLAVRSFSANFVRRPGLSERR